MASLDTTSTYSLTNSYTGPEKLLAISTSDSKTPQMLAVPNSPASNAQWFLRATDYAPFYYLHTIRGGTGKALDVINDNDTSSRHLILANTGLYTGQFWRFDEWPSGGPYAYRLSNNFTGPDMHLDVYSDTLEPHLASDDASGQHWRLEEVSGDINTGNGGSGTATERPGALSITSTATGTQATETAGPSSAPAQVNGQEEVLSAGAIAGIAIGGVTALALLVFVIAYVLLGVRKRKQSPDGSAMAKASPDSKTYNAAGGTITPLPGHEPAPLVSQGLAGAKKAELGSRLEQAPLVELESVERQRQELPDQLYV